MSWTRSFPFHLAARRLTPTTCSLPTAYATSARATALASHARRESAQSVKLRNRTHRKTGQHDRDAYWLSITICCRLDALVAGVGESPSRAPIAPIAPWAEIPPQELFFDMRTKTQVDRHRRVYTGGGVDSRERAGATQRHTLIFLSLRKWKSVTQLLRNAQNRRWVLPFHETLIPLQSTPERATDLPSCMTLISLQSAPDSGGARQHHSPMQDR